MSITAARLIMECPEFLLAIIIAVATMFSLRGDDRRPAQIPGWLTQPAKSLLLLMPDRYLIWAQRSLLQGGWRSNTSFGNFASFKLYSALLCFGLALWLPVYSVLITACVAFMLPDVVLHYRVKRRQAEIHSSLPRALDLMILCVDAGLGLDATLQRISAENTGLADALNDELKILGREILLGMDREKAYQELYNRTGVDELKTLGSALNQASKLGLSLVRILRAQSDFIYKKLSQKAEEKAMRMPILMAFPLWFFIMPSLMLLVLGPSLIRFYEQWHLSSQMFR